MINLTRFSSAIVVGLGRVGNIIANYLMRRKIYTYVYDDNKKIFSSHENTILTANNFFRTLSIKQSQFNSQKPKFAIVSPGISDSSNICQFLKSNRIRMIDEIEFTSAFIKNPIIAITGTNGKSTTTVLLGKILAATGRNIFWGGNLAPGLPFATALYQEPKDVYVIETSSFQLSRCYRFHPHIAIITNITADHLDRHTSLTEYQKSKFRIFRSQNKKDYAIINYDDETTMKRRDSIPSQIMYFSKNHKVNGAYIQNENIYFQNTRICALNDIKLFGKHFMDTVLAAITASKILLIDNHIIVNVLKQFAGLDHRLQFVRQHAGVTYINNSMCTNPVAAVATLKSFNQPVILIAGGKEKNLDASEFIKTITSKAKFVILLGENQNLLSEALAKNNYYRFRKVNSMKQAVLTAKNKAVPNDIVLFSPGFSSFDKFKNFQERGFAFSKIVYAI